MPIASSLDTVPTATVPRHSRQRFALIQAGIFIVLSTVLRVVLTIRFHPDSASQGLPEGTVALPGAGEWVRVFATGLFLDGMVAALLFAPYVAWFAVWSDRWLQMKWQRFVVGAATTAFWIATLFFLQGEYFFFAEYTSRYNTVAIDYVHYWTEVSANVAEMYPWKSVVTASVLGSLAIVWFLLRKAWPSPGQRLLTRWGGAAGWLGAAASLTWAASLVNFHASGERVLNELSSNGLTSGAIALWTRELDYAHFFPTLPRDEAFDRTRHQLDTPGAVWSANHDSIQRHIPGDASRRKLNVVVLLEESLGSEFWGCLGNEPQKRSLTPCLDHLAQDEGILFTDLLADGNRTIRGIEAVLASFPPLPGDSLVARPKAHGCETLATTLGRDGYASTFIYPGRGVFDGLERFTLANGFDRFIEGKDFPHPAYSTVWGHCDEDLYDRVLEEARVGEASGKPFFITALTVSNHQPFDFPSGRIAEPNDRHSRKYAVKYVDYALGRFFAMAKQEPFWKDTIFAVVADHGARVYGSETVPMVSYEIPLLLLGGAVPSKGERISTPGCQLDVAPTLLGLIGRPYDSVFYGRDLLAPASSRFALLNHNRSIALYREPEMLALSLGNVVERYVRKDASTLARIPLDAVAQETSRDATALFQTADELYNQRRYSVTPTTHGATLATGHTLRR